MKKKYLDEIHECYLINLYNLLGRRWAIPILHSFIKNENQSYSDIEKYFNKIINPTILSDLLKSMEDLQIINKCDKSYIITDFGKELSKLLHEIKRLAIKNNLKIPKSCTAGECLCEKNFSFEEFSKK